ncbi:MAG TPA: class I SAM-dependent methyltransferase, partial [Vicinamibacteria bacterium]|nr:class I SAM-dependent methyltransferase [Vicinamibacteria bacterium]
MKGLSKVCDAADWFAPEMLEIVREELRETPRFHRKQWEFAAIFRALRREGLLAPDRRGLSMGGGRELLLYAVARHVRQLVVTDLYDPRTTWAEARTDDPRTFLLESMPFPVDPDRLQALRMDMRRLEFEDASFDFAYSACAIEHIGDWADFVGHLAEVYRVLRPGGVYAFTTEFHYGPETIEHPGNYVFSAGYLNDLFAASPFVAEPVCESGILRHRANQPLPENLQDLRILPADHLAARLGAELPHVQLLRGHLPHASALFVLRKQDAGAKGPVSFPGLEASRDYLAEGALDYRRWVEDSWFGLDPMGYMPGRSSPFVGATPAEPPSDRTVFHTEYVWLGGGRRSVVA